MKYSIKLLSLFLILSTIAQGLHATANNYDTIPSVMLGKFVDDYDIHYEISDTLWKQEGGMTYEVIEWNTTGQFVIVRNGAQNGKDANLYSRIDYMSFSNMAPWNWGYCLTIYNAKTKEEALKVITADRKNPKKGCNGFPFSRMKKD